MVVSGLPLTTLPSDVRDRIVEQMVTILAPGGTNLVLQYSTMLRRELEGGLPARTATVHAVERAAGSAVRLFDDRPETLVFTAGSSRRTTMRDR